MISPPKMDKAPPTSTVEEAVDQSQDQGLIIEKSGTFRVRVKRMKRRLPKPEVTLHKANSPWVPPSILKQKKGGTATAVGGSRSGGGNDSVPVPASVIKKSRAILNKITPTSFDKLLSQFLALPLGTDADIRGVVKLLVDKASNDPFYSDMYARMVEKICDASPVSNKFRKLLLDQCRRAFLNRFGSQLKKKVVKPKLGKTKDEKICQEQELKSELEDTHYLRKFRSLGTLRFLGELYKKQLLSLSIMAKDIVGALLANFMDNQLELERLCVLLTTIGEQLELDIKGFQERASLWEQAKFLPGPSWMDKMFSKLEALTEEERISPRIRFMVMDLVELRQDGWKPRRAVNHPKTIEEVREEAKSQLSVSASLSKSRSWTRPNAPLRTKSQPFKRDKVNSKKNGKAKPKAKSLAKGIQRASHSLMAFTQQESEGLKDSKLQLLKRIRDCADKMESILVEPEK